VSQASSAASDGDQRTGNQDDALREVLRLLATIRYGSITLTVQDGRVVQIEATHKLRLGGRRS
jgi:hypothetical protein